MLALTDVRGEREGVWLSDGDKHAEALGDEDAERLGDAEGEGDGNGVRDADDERLEDLDARDDGEPVNVALVDAHGLGNDDTEANALCELDSVALDEPLGRTDALLLPVMLGDFDPVRVSDAALDLDVLPEMVLLNVDVTEGVAGGDTVPLLHAEGEREDRVDKVGERDAEGEREGSEDAEAEVESLSDGAPDGEACDVTERALERVSVTAALLVGEPLAVRFEDALELPEPDEDGVVALAEAAAELVKVRRCVSPHVVSADALTETLRDGERDADVERVPVGEEDADLLASGELLGVVVDEDDWDSREERLGELEDDEVFDADIERLEVGVDEGERDGDSDAVIDVLREGQVDTVDVADIVLDTSALRDTDTEVDEDLEKGADRDADDDAVNDATVPEAVDDAELVLAREGDGLNVVVRVGNGEREGETLPEAVPVPQPESEGEADAEKDTLGLTVIGVAELHNDTRELTVRAAVTLEIGEPAADTVLQRDGVEVAECVDDADTHMLTRGVADPDELTVPEREALPDADGEGVSLPGVVPLIESVPAADEVTLALLLGLCVSDGEVVTDTEPLGEEHALAVADADAETLGERL